MATTESGIKVLFHKQGGRECMGVAVGRKGKSLLIQYRIEDGSPRERWLPPHRIIDLFGDPNDLPRYRTVKCPGEKLAQPVTFTGYSCSHLRFIYDFKASRYTREYKSLEGFEWSCDDPATIARLESPCPKCGEKHGLITGNWGGGIDTHYTIVGTHSRSWVEKVED